MAISLIGVGGATAEVETASKALRVTQRPLDAGALGHYRMSTTVALVVTQAANGTLFSFRWGDATRLCVPQYIRIQCLQTSAATATIMPSFEVVVARSFTVADSIGTALTLTGNQFKKRTSMGTTLVSDIRKATVAAGLTAGTRTLDLEAILQMPTSQAITTPNAQLYSAFIDLSDGAEHPLVFAQNEGFIVRGPSVVFGAAGTANLTIDMDWAEVAAF